MDWPCLLAYITGTIDQEFLLRNESLVTETGFLKSRSRAGCSFEREGKSNGCDFGRIFGHRKNGIGMSAK